MDRAYTARMSDSRKPARVLRASEIAAAARPFTHPWNPHSAMRASWLGHAASLARTGVNLLTVPPGNESFTYHAHLHEEEWIYILSGRAVIDDGDAQHEVGAGDFVAFPTPSQPHQLRNPFETDVVYLSGGERAAFDVADFPRYGKRLVRIGDKATVYDLGNGSRFPFPDIEPL
jgi:uncharacterized cupin superfamily protein